MGGENYFGLEINCALVHTVEIMKDNSIWYMFFHIGAPFRQPAAVGVSHFRDLIRVRNAVLWAPAGYGKTKILTQEILPMLRDVFGRTKVWATAMTGNAAALIGGNTIHSDSGVKTGAGSVQTLSNTIRRSRRLRTRWRTVECIVLEECSMCSEDLFSKLEAIARNVRNSTEFFGGIRILLCGDFFQLPPCSDMSYDQSVPGYYGGPSVRRTQQSFLFQVRFIWNAITCYVIRLGWNCLDKMMGCSSICIILALLWMIYNVICVVGRLLPSR